MPRNNTYIYFLNAQSTYFSYHVEDEDFASNSYVFGSSKDLVICLTFWSWKLEDSNCEKSAGPRVLKDHPAGLQPFHAIKTAIFEQMHLPRLDRSLKIRPFVWLSGYLFFLLHQTTR